MNKKKSRIDINTTKDGFIVRSDDPANADLCKDIAQKILSDLGQAEQKGRFSMLIERPTSQQDGASFSPESILALFENFNSIITKVIAHGFDTNKPLMDLKVTLNIEANGKPIDIPLILKKYPLNLILNKRKLAEQVLRDYPDDDDAEVKK